MDLIIDSLITVNQDLINTSTFEKNYGLQSKDYGLK